MLLSITGGSGRLTVATNDRYITTMSKTASPVEATILVDYRVLDGWHIFTSDQVRGLYVAHPDQREAYEAVGPTIEKLLAENERVLCEVRPAMTFEAFLERARSHRDMPSITPGVPQPFIMAKAVEAAR